MKAYKIIYLKYELLYMANFPYYFSEPNAGIRKGIVEAHAGLAKLGKTIYAESPKRISLYLSFKHRVGIRNFFNKTLTQMETLTEIERLKKKEALYNLSRFEHWLQSYANVFVLIFGSCKVLKVEPEWLYKHQLMFLRDIPFEHIVKRLSWLGFSLFLFKYNYVFKDILIGLFYPDLLCDLQIGKEFELGYWVDKFVGELEGNR